MMLVVMMLTWVTWRWRLLEQTNEKSFPKRQFNPSLKSVPIGLRSYKAPKRVLEAISTPQGRHSTWYFSPLDQLLWTHGSPVADITAQAATPAIELVETDSPKYPSAVLRLHYGHQRDVVIGLDGSRLNDRVINLLVLSPHT